MTYTEKLKKLAEDMASEQTLPAHELQSRMEDLDLNYSDDEIERYNQILMALHQLKNEKNKTPNQERHH